jgi:hypothetical protein
MGVESYYDAKNREVWVGKAVILKDGREGVVKDIRQTDGFRNPAQDYDFCLILEDGSEASPWTTKVKPTGPLKIMVEIEVTDEDLRAGNYMFASDQPERRMDEEEMVRFVLRPALEARLHALRSRMKWREGKFWEHPNLRKEEGRRMADLVDRDGNTHAGMIPTGRHYPVRVDSPREGTWACPDSPTGRCWYDNQRDPAWDGCVFCGEPHERK